MADSIERKSLPDDPWGKSSSILQCARVTAGNVISIAIPRPPGRQIAGWRSATQAGYGRERIAIVQSDYNVVAGGSQGIGVPIKGVVTGRVDRQGISRHAIGKEHDWSRASVGRTGARRIDKRLDAGERKRIGNGNRVGIHQAPRDRNHAIQREAAGMTRGRGRSRRL